MTDTSPGRLESPALFLADYAAVESGKLYVGGGYWSRLNFAGFPASYSFAVGAVILIPWRDAAEHAFRLRFDDADGAPVGGEINGSFSAVTAADARVGEATVMPIAATFGNFVFERPGDFVVVLEVDGEPLNRWAFRAVLQPGVSPSPGPGAFDPTNIPGL